MKRSGWGILLTLALTACQGVFDDIYDQPEQAEPTREGLLYVDASSWRHWHYIDLKALSDSLRENPHFDPSSAFVSYEIPTEPSDENDGRTGIYTYWYDVFGAGLSNHERRDSFLTTPQPEPETWSLAIHRNNVRTHGGAVYETPYTSMDDLPESSEAFADAPFTPDAWNETDVWTVSTQMLSGLIGNQGIEANPVLSSWLDVSLPPVPPVFTLNSHVFVLRMADGTCAALQLANYQNAAGVKCCMTINYKYPY